MHRCVRRVSPENLYHPRMRICPGAVGPGDQVEQGEDVEIASIGLRELLPHVHEPALLCLEGCAGVVSHEPHQLLGCAETLEELGTVDRVHPGLLPRGGVSDIVKPGGTRDNLRHGGVEVEGLCQTTDALNVLPPHAEIAQLMNGHVARSREVPGHAKQTSRPVDRGVRADESRRVDVVSQECLDLVHVLCCQSRGAIRAEVE